MQPDVSGSSLLSTVVSIVLQLLPAVTFQEVAGFGGTVTDQAAINIQGVSNVCQNGNLTDKILRSYFDPNGGRKCSKTLCGPLNRRLALWSFAGLALNLVRLPISACDASPRQYTYDDSPVDDFHLAGFSLAEEDLKYKVDTAGTKPRPNRDPWLWGRRGHWVHFQIPVLQEAQKLSNGELSVLASSWSAPAWMKRCNCTVGGQLFDRMLKGEPDGPYYKAWAQYFVK